jgi:hypothetical protein
MEQSLVEKSGRKKYITGRKFEEAPKNGKELSHSAHANGMNERMNGYVMLW